MQFTERQRILREQHEPQHTVSIEQSYINDIHSSLFLPPDVHNIADDQDQQDKGYHCHSDVDRELLVLLKCLKHF
jgi:hypothetical protein